MYLSSSSALRLPFYYVCGHCYIINHCQSLEEELDLQSLKAWKQLSLTTPNFSQYRLSSALLSSSHQGILHSHTNAQQIQYNNACIYQLELMTMPINVQLYFALIRYTECIDISFLAMLPGSPGQWRWNIKINVEAKQGQNPVFTRCDTQVTLKLWKIIHRRELWFCNGG